MQQDRKAWSNLQYLFPLHGCECLRSTAPILHTQDISPQSLQIHCRSSSTKHDDRTKECLPSMFHFVHEARTRQSNVRHRLSQNTHTACRVDFEHVTRSEQHEIRAKQASTSTSRTALRYYAIFPHILDRKLKNKFSNKATRNHIRLSVSHAIMYTDLD